MKARPVSYPCAICGDEIACATTMRAAGLDFELVVDPSALRDHIAAHLDQQETK